MTKTFEIAIFQGDGIGPEIMAPTLAVLESMSGLDCAFSFKDLPAGAEHYARTGDALPEASMQAAEAADAILLSAMGMPSIRYPNGQEIAPQLDLRERMGLFAGVRPVRIAKGQPTPLKLDHGQEVDFVLVRESTEGLFHSRKSPDVRANEAYETMKITRETSEKLFRFTFELARQRKAAGRGPGRVTCVDKANVLGAFVFFREVFDGVAQDYPDLNADHTYVDATALWMVEKPESFDVMVTENMFGDILSDLGAGLMGGLGLAPSADIGAQNAVFQPCHGSAPDIAGKGMANPFAMILSAAMMLDWLAIQHDHAPLAAGGTALREAVEAEIAQRTCVTPDLGGTATTDEAAAAIAARLT